MRISDWSSDVCSSDLHRWRARRESTSSASDVDSQHRESRADLEHPRVLPRLGQLAAGGQTRSRERPDAGDRKSDVQVKSVSVRVDLGGRRNIKKQRNISSCSDPGGQNSIDEKTTSQTRQ